MIRRFYIILCLAFLVACDDGDILTVDLVFDGELDQCENNNESYLIYDLKEDPSESLSLILPKNATNELLFTTATPIDNPVIININGTDVRFNYRTYNRTVVNNGSNKELCATIPPSNLNILEDYEAFSGTVEVTSTFEDDDEDGVPTEFEGRGEPDADGNFPNAQDTDLDGIPDYLDEDDDNDNVKTIDEIDNSDGDDDPTTNPMDTDGDGELDYLDMDDDGDGIDTRLEDENGVNGPGDDYAENEAGETVPHYKNTLEDTSYEFTGFIENAPYIRTVRTSFIIRDFDLEIFRTEFIDFGTLVNEFDPNDEDDD